VKNVGFASASRWHREIPDRILAQIIDQLDVTGYGHAHYACLVGGNVMKQGIVYADRETELRDYLRAEVRRFRAEHLLTGREPEWNVSEKPDKMIALDEATHPERVGTLDIEGIGEVMEYARLARRKADAETARKAAAARLRQLADGREFVTFAGQPAYRLGPTADERRPRQAQGEVPGRVRRSRGGQRDDVAHDLHRQGVQGRKGRRMILRWAKKVEK
jgi:hypothetical protein